MYLQLFDSVLKLSILVNCKNLRFAQYFLFCANYAKKRAKLIALHALKIRKSSQKNISPKIMQILCKKYGNFVDTLLNIETYKVCDKYTRKFEKTRALGSRSDTSGKLSRKQSRLYQLLPLN